MHCDVFETIWNCREIDEQIVSKACILVVSKAIWNYREIDENNVHLKIHCDVFETIWNCREI